MLLKKAKRIDIQGHTVCSLPKVGIHILATQLASGPKPSLPTVAHAARIWSARAAEKDGLPGGNRCHELGVGAGHSGGRTNRVLLAAGEMMGNSLWPLRPLLWHRGRNEGSQQDGNDGEAGVGGVSYAHQDKEGWREEAGCLLVSASGGLFGKNWSDPCWANFPPCPPDARSALGHPAGPGRRASGPHLEGGRQVPGYFRFSGSETAPPLNLRPRGYGQPALLALGDCSSFLYPSVCKQSFHETLPKFPI